MSLKVRMRLSGLGMALVAVILHETEAERHLENR